MSLGLWLLSSYALGGDAVKLELRHTVQHGQDWPQLTLLTQVQGQLRVSLQCGGASFPWQGAVRPGGSVEIELSGLPPGQHSCSGQLDLETSDGGGQMPLQFQVALLPPLSLQVDPQDLNLEGRRLSVQASRPLQKLELEVLGERGKSLGGALVQEAGASPVELGWHQQEGEVLKLELLGTDIHGLVAALELSPWSYSIPHEDVVFASGSAQIAPEERPKLEEAWSELEEVVQRYGDVVEVRLFIAGYTDTVGDPASNLQLSLRRAESIATWFRQRGFSEPVSYQGFGESVLARSTADEVDEAANRRALYIVAAQVPPLSEELPSDRWQVLP